MYAMGEQLSRKSTKTAELYIMHNIQAWNYAK
nr:MAG TPA: hypothetical protein [Caudoviricetes sp.]